MAGNYSREYLSSPEDWEALVISIHGKYINEIVDVTPRRIE
jgi:hypothetical protein